jgi:hypothetical protein
LFQDGLLEGLVETVFLVWRIVHGDVLPANGLIVNNKLRYC